MIVKNEAHVIERVLRSCLPIIDGYVINDTGSTDDTIKIIKSFFDDHQIDGIILENNFTNFSESRNIALNNTIGDYMLWIDADEELILSETFNKDEFKSKLLSSKPDVVYFNCKYGNNEYKRNQLVPLNLNYKWTGPVHEVLTTDNDISNYIIFDQGFINITSDGHSWTSSLYEKYLSHAEILEKYQIENDWSDPRWTFYLA